MSRHIEFECVTSDDLEPSWIARANLLQRGYGTLVALDRNHSARAFGEQRACQSARARPDLDHHRAVQGTCGPRDAAGEIEIEQKILAERFLGGKTVTPD